MVTRQCYLRKIDDLCCIWLCCVQIWWWGWDSPTIWSFEHDESY